MTEVFEPGEEPAQATVLCPICLDTFPLPVHGSALFTFDGKTGQAQQVSLDGVRSRAKRDAIRRFAFVQCPNPSSDHRTHYLPLLYATYHRPIVVGFIGGSQTGKTHLLASMIGEIENGGLTPYGLKADALDPPRHRQMLDRLVRPLLTDGRALGKTVEGVTDFVNALLISSDAGTWPVAFFDVAGEDLSQDAANTRFLNGLNALLFVADPGFDPAGGHSERVSEQAYRSVLGRLHPGSGYLDIPAAVVINKADQVRFVPPVDRWLRQAGDGKVDPKRILAESRDAYAFLHARGAGALLQPYQYCRRCTLHFASATGGDKVGDQYPLGARPRRVLEPFIALLAMHDVFGSGLAEVGR